MTIRDILTFLFTLFDDVIISEDVTVNNGYVDINEHGKQVLETIGRLQVLASYINTYIEENKAVLLNAMDGAGFVKQDIGSMNLKYTPEKSTVRFDQSAFKKDYPDLFEKYRKEVPQKRSLQVNKVD